MNTFNAIVAELNLQDGNIPNGESFVRQFLLGQKFFEKEFGVRCQEVSTSIASCSVIVSLKEFFLTKLT